MRPNVAAPVPKAGVHYGHRAVSLVLLVCFVVCPLAPVLAVYVERRLLRQLRWPVVVFLLPGLLAIAVVLGVLALVVGNPLLWHYTVLNPYSGVPVWLALLRMLPLGVAVGYVGGVLLVGVLEFTAAYSEISPFVQRREIIARRRRDFHVGMVIEDEQALERAEALPLGVVVEGDLGTFRDSQVPLFVRVPPRHRLAMGVVGGSGTGKTVTLERLAKIWANAGRKLVFADFKGSDPELVARLVAGYLSERPNAVIGVWPASPMDIWRGTPEEVANRLLLVQEYSEPFYKAVCVTVIRLVMQAPDPEGRPIRSSVDFLERLDLDYLSRAYHGRPEMREVNELAKGDKFAGVRLRYKGFFDALGGRFDGGFSFEDADLVIMQVPSLSNPDDAEAIAKIILTDYGHYSLKRKPRIGEPSTFVVDEFSAVGDVAARMVVDLGERVRDVDSQVVPSVQSYTGLGSNESERHRVIGALGGGIILHRVAECDEFVGLAGTVRDTEQSWQLADGGPSGAGSVRIHHRLRVNPDEVRQARIGEAWVIAHGRAIRMRVCQSDLSDELRQLAEVFAGRLRMSAEVLHRQEALEVPEWADRRLPAPVRLQLVSAPSLLELMAGGPSPKPAPGGDAVELEVDKDPHLERLRLEVMAAVRSGDVEHAQELAELVPGVPLEEWTAQRARVMAAARPSRLRDRRHVR